MSGEESFTETTGVRFMSQLPRFGYSSEFSKLASSDPDDQVDYVLGIAAVSFFILSIFIFLGAAIITCKCMGKRRVGLCAGRVHVVADEKGKFRPPYYLCTLRFSFMALGCCMILLCVTLVGPGLGSIESTSVSIRKVNRDVNDLITQGLLIMDSVKRVRWNIDTIDVESILRVEEACPNLENNAFISDKRLRTSIRGLGREFEELKEYLEQSDFEVIRQHIDYVMDGTEFIDSAVSVIEKNDWIVRMFALFLTVMVFFMILAACFARCQYLPLPALKCMSELFILPMFVLAIVGSWFVTSVLAFASISNADCRIRFCLLPLPDFCSGNQQQSGPAGTVMDIFEEREISKDDVIFAAFSYYQSTLVFKYWLQGCETGDPIKHLYKYEDDLQSGIGSANKFLVQADEIGIDEISEQCGADVSPIIEGIGLIKDNLGILLGALRQVNLFSKSSYEFASCQKMSPIYRQAFEGTVCTDSSGSLTLVFSIMFAISVVGIILIMLRSAIYPYKKVYHSSSLDEEQDEWEEYQAYLQYMTSFVNMWGGNEADEDGISVKTGTFDTLSASSESSGNTLSKTPSSFVRVLESCSTISSNENTTDEEAPLSPHTPALDASFRRSHSQDEIYENEELMPLSPESEFSTDSIIYQTSDQSRLFTPQTKQVAGGERDDDDECKHLTPQTQSIHASGRLTRRFNTPDFLTPGRFTRWRQQGRVEVKNDDELPETPLMASPMEHHKGVNYFDNIISPLRRDSPVVDVAGKRE
ncbi:hypothetical protein ACHAXR_012818 [Thalassiosira sp. AJA248-18]